MAQTLVFGDQTFDTSCSLQDLLQVRRTSRYLDLFLNDIDRTFRYETAKLVSNERLWFPAARVEAFTDPSAGQGGFGAATQTFLTCVVQLGYFVLSCEREPKFLEAQTDLAIIGICTGALSGVAAAAAHSLQDLLLLANVVAQASFHLGLAVQRRAEAIEKTSGPWAFTTTSISVAETALALESYNQALPPHKRVYVSSKSEKSLTFSGPPSALQGFKRHPIFETSKTLELPTINAPFHAAHLGQLGLADALRRLVSPVSDRIVRRKFISTDTGASYAGLSLHETLIAVIATITESPLDWTLLTTGLSKQLVKSGKDTRTVLIPIGPAACSTFLSRELGSHGVCVSPPPKAPNATAASGICPAQDIAIVGMAGRFPGADDLDGFWEVLMSGADLHAKIPKDRFDVDTHFDPTGAMRNSTLSPYGVFVDQPGLFDVRLFNMSPREAAQTCPMQRLLLMTTYEALEMAGYALDRTPSSAGSRIGTFFGQTSDDWREVNASQDVDTFFITGGIRAFGPGRLNYHFNWDGPSYSVDTACSSSAASIQLACTALLAGEIDTAVAGGANILTASDLFAGLSRGGFLSKTGGCKTFDDDADGYVRGDAVGTVVLKRFEDARADNDNILAVIKAVATNHSSQAVSITHPHSETQQELFRTVLRSSGLKPSNIDAVELHGTGTQAGDFTEFSSVLGVFGDRSLDEPIYVSSVKPNIGHGEAASGVSSLIKSVLMLQHNEIPPHVGIKTRINHRLPPLDTVPIELARKAMKWPDTHGKEKRILINNFDAAGGNTSMVIEAAPPQPVSGKDPRTHHVVCVSGRTVASFEQNRTRLLQFVRANKTVDLASLAYTTTSRRQHHVFRRAYKCQSVTDLINTLENDDSSAEAPTRSSKPKLTFLFTGQGSQFTGMAKDLFHTNSQFKQWLVEYDVTSRQFGFAPFIGLCTGELDVEHASPTQIQLALISIELAITKLWQSWGVTPDVLLGHSLGEYAALVVAEVLSAHDALFLVGSRAQLMEAHCSQGTHSMLAIKLGADSVEEVLATLSLSSCEIACLNGPEATVVSGRAEEISELNARLISDDIKTRALTVPFAFHSGQLDPMLEAYGQLTELVQVAPPQTTFISTLTGQTITDSSTINAEYLVNQCRRPVNFVGALQAAHNERLVNDSTLWLEVGPKPICTGMVKAFSAVPPVRLISSLDGGGDWSSLSTALTKFYNAGVDIKWTQIHREFEPSLRLINLPSYAFDLKNYWIQYDGNWSITKNQTKSIESSESSPFATTSLHRVESEQINGENVTVIFSTNIADPGLLPAVLGHQVNKVGLCPSSLYAEMAMSAGAYVHRITSPDTETPGMQISEMEVTKPFVAAPDETEQYISLTARRTIDSRVVKLSFSSTTDGKPTEHAQCLLTYGDSDEWLSDWSRQQYLIDSRIQNLKHGEDSAAHKIHRRMVYKLFASLVTYSSRYQGLTRVFLDSDAFEAVGDVTFPPAPSNEDFFFSPYWIDSLLHISGFVLNGSDTTSDDAVYISHGWKSLRLPKQLEEGRMYQTYVRMQPLGSDQVMAGDVYILDQGAVVGLCTGLKFQRIRKSILNHLLPGQKGPPPPMGTTAVTRAPRQAKRLGSVVPQATEATFFDHVLALIAQEVQVSPSELSDDVEFAEVGVDSLLSLAITDKLRRMTDKEMPSSIFLTCTTVADLRAYFQDGVTDSSSEDLDDSDASSKRSLYSSANTSTDDLVLASRNASESKAMVLKQIIAEELGVGESEITPDTEFSEVGLDSLLSLAIAGRVKAQTGQALDADFFISCPTYRHVLKFYAVAEGPPKPVTSSREQTRRAQKLRATSTLLQGNSGSKDSIFLFPDGSGSAAAYQGLASITSDATVYGLNSPHLRSGEVFEGSIESITAVYVTELRSRRPTGPYTLGGWSIGGVYAYEAARQLLVEGAQIVGLLLIDSPCPRRLPPMSEATIDLLAAEGIFGAQRTIPTSLRNHFLGSVKALHRYTPKAIPKSEHVIPALALWARHGVFQGPEHAELLARIHSDGINDWLLAPRTSFGSTGWDELLPGYRSEVVDGNHFTMFRKPLIDDLSHRIRDALHSFSSVQ